MGAGINMDRLQELPAKEKWGRKYEKRVQEPANNFLLRDRLRHTAKIQPRLYSSQPSFLGSRLLASYSDNPLTPTMERNSYNVKSLTCIPSGVAAKRMDCMAQKTTTEVYIKV